MGPCPHPGSRDQRDCCVERRDWEARLKLHQMRQVGRCVELRLVGLACELWQQRGRASTAQVQEGALMPFAQDRRKIL